MSASVAKLNKPQLRGMLNSAIKKNITVSLILTAISGVVTQVFLCDARKNKYAEFYKTYDAEEDYTRMQKAGIFQSVPA